MWEGSQAQDFRDAALVWRNSAPETSVSPPLSFLPAQVMFFARPSGPCSEVWRLWLGGAGLFSSLGPAPCTSQRGGFVPEEWSPGGESPTGLVGAALVWGRGGGGVLLWPQCWRGRQEPLGTEESAPRGLGEPGLGGGGREQGRQQA